MNVFHFFVLSFFYLCLFSASIIALASLWFGIKKFTGSKHSIVGNTRILTDHCQSIVSIRNENKMRRCKKQLKALLPFFCWHWTISWGLCCAKIVRRHVWIPFVRTHIFEINWQFGPFQHAIFDFSNFEYTKKNDLKLNRWNNLLTKMHIVAFCIFLDMNCFTFLCARQFGLYSVARCMLLRYWSYMQSVSKYFFFTFAP